MACDSSSPGSADSSSLGSTRGSCLPASAIGLGTDAPRLISVNPIGRDPVGNIYILIQQSIDDRPTKWVGFNRSQVLP
jgi:hypothetical protein